ncbi:protein phosphatase 1 regulatory subunit 21 isoform X2 [Cylas formicarius]|nr:protein phosphatase 1 regulatory subunit 21 isoform X2 [Cylas formicarius]
MRKHDQEMESLTFRNEQLTKRILVLQQELHVSSDGRKGKQKNLDHLRVDDTSVLNEELQKKIIENAQLLSDVSDKEIEIRNYKEKIIWQEDKLTNFEEQLAAKEEIYKENIDKLQNEKDALMNKYHELSKTKMTQNFEQISICDIEENMCLKNELEKLRSECEVLRSKPSSKEQLTSYYECQIRDILESKALAQSETKSLLAENQALKSRLENFILEYTDLQNNLEKSYEELVTTNENYKSQLDAMTEHLAAQNEKITQQCDEIQILKHKLSGKK